ncbi:hypothetical protein HK099_007686 [Clydaea vesicula]|uniref:N-acetyltransferase domain-containing protein n=1 Tax=Clydaea vesicula TaxID=447962 RepID=A0AAD5TWN7_9FUNG|nr:hypothetical protein HK099_007686 [Clydaea vesicula]KAJ3397454.1 hypothetical protein HDU92_007843 [Lobulomyces angularis]
MTVEKKNFNLATSELTLNHAKQLQTINKVVLNSHYDLKFSKNACNDLTLLGFFNDITSGAITCKKLDEKSIEIETIAVLKNYQNFGLGSLLVKDLLKNLSTLKFQKAFVKISKLNNITIELFKKFEFAVDTECKENVERDEDFVYLVKDIVAEN